MDTFLCTLYIEDNTVNLSSYWASFQFIHVKYIHVQCTSNADALMLHLCPYTVINCLVSDQFIRLESLGLGRKNAADHFSLT